MSTFQTRLFGATDRRTQLIYSLLAASVALTAYKTRNKWWMRLLTQKCDGSCGESGFHTHHLTKLGKWHYVYRYRVYTLLVPDFRPQPIPGAWFADYAKAWQDQYEGFPVHSTWVRDENGYWVWVTDTPGFDRVWFDKMGWQFPARWIPVSAQAFYTVGHDGISDVVSIEPQVPDESEVFK